MVFVILDYRAVIQYDPEIEMFRGEFIGLNGGADFYAPDDIDGLRREGEISLRVFLDMCRQDGVKLRKAYSGRFNPVVTHLSNFQTGLTGLSGFS